MPYHLTDEVKTSFPALPSDLGGSSKPSGHGDYIAFVPCSTLSRRLEDISEEFTGSQIGIKRESGGNQG